MENLEIAELELIRSKLIEKVCNLRSDLTLHKQDSPFDLEEVYPNLMDDKLINNDTTINETNDKKQEHQLNRIAQASLGVQFRKIVSTWEQDNIHKYLIDVATKAVQLEIELTVEKDEEKESFVIVELDCHFDAATTDDCYFKELEGWILKFALEKNFSLLIGSLSDYSDKFTIRALFVRKLQQDKYVHAEKCNSEGGGISLKLRSTQDKRLTYASIGWILELDRAHLTIEHKFTIKSTEEGVQFVQQHKEAIENLLKPRQTVANLKEAWASICDAIQEYEEESSDLQ